MTRVGHPAVPEPPRPDMFSNARVVGRHFFVSGMHAGTPDGPVGGADVYRQAREAFRRTRALVEACGAQVDDILALRIYVTDIGAKAAVGRARAEMFRGDFPCSTLVAVSALVEDGLSVEVEAQGIISAAATADA